MPTNIHVIENDNENNEHGIDENLLPEHLREARRAIVARHDAGLRELHANAWKWQEKVIRLNEGIEREIQPDFDRDKEPFRRFLLEGFELSQFAPKGEKNVEEYLLNLHRFQKAVIDWTLQGVNKSLTDIRIPIVTSDTSGDDSKQVVKRLLVDRRKRMVFGEQIDKEYLRLSKEEGMTVKREIFEKMNQDRSRLFGNILSPEELNLLTARALEERHGRYLESRNLKNDY